MDDSTIFSAIDNLFNELKLERDMRTVERIHRLITSTKTLQEAGFQPVFYRRQRAVGAINRRFAAQAQPAGRGTPTPDGPNDGGGDGRER